MNDLQGEAIVYMAPRYACITDSSRACSDIQVQYSVSERSNQTFGFIGNIVLRNRLKNVNRKSFAAHHHFVRLIVQNGPALPGSNWGPFEHLEA
jgi:hypothetical protein